MALNGVGARPHDLVQLLETKNALLRSHNQELQARYDAVDRAEDRWIGKITQLYEVLWTLFDAVSLPMGLLADENCDCGQLLEQIEDEIPRLKNIITGHEMLTNMAIELTTKRQISEKENEDLQKHNAKLRAKTASLESENVTLQCRLRDTLELFQQELDFKTAFLERSKIKSLDDVERMIAARINKDMVSATLERSWAQPPVH